MVQLTQWESPVDSCIIITLIRQKVKLIVSKCLYRPKEFFKTHGSMQGEMKKAPHLRKHQEELGRMFST